MEYSIVGNSSGEKGKMVELKVQKKDRRFWSNEQNLVMV